MESAQVVFEESTAEKSGAVDSSPMDFKTLWAQLETRGHLNLKLTGHKVSRPASVMRGEESDRQGMNKSMCSKHVKTSVIFY